MCYAGCVLEHPGAREDMAGWAPASSFPVPVNRWLLRFCLRVWELYGPVRGCPWNWWRRSPRARTYSGQHARREPHETSFPQVSSRVEVQAGGVCKTVGSAYVGSNPTPATTCETGPLAGNSRLRGPFSFVPACVTLLRCRPSYCAVHGRIADGRPCRWDGRCALLGRSVRTVGVSTDGHGRAASAACSGLT